MKIIKIKSVLFSLCFFGSFQLFPMDMEVELYKKSEDHCWLKGSLFFADNMYENRILPRDVANIITYTSYLLRMNQIYKKFDPFFCFDNDNYSKMSSDHIKNKQLFIANKTHLTLADREEFRNLYPNNTHLCRKFGIIQPYHLLFFTKKQDEILRSLIFLNCFKNDKGYFSLHLTEQEKESYLMLPFELQQLLKKYPQFAYPVCSNNGGTSDVYTREDVDMSC